MAYPSREWYERQINPTPSVEWSNDWWCFLALTAYDEPVACITDCGPEDGDRQPEDPWAVRRIVWTDEYEVVPAELFRGTLDECKAFAWELVTAE